jgi:hypothetical protein
MKAPYITEAVTNERNGENRMRILTGQAKLNYPGKNLPLCHYVQQITLWIFMLSKIKLVD